MRRFLQRQWQLVLALVLALVAAGAVLFHLHEDRVESVMYRIKTTGPLSVVSVADGDTIKISPRFGKNLDVRLLGINAKELSHPGLRVQEECYGKEAREYVRKIALGKWAYLAFDPLKSVSEDHDRLLGYIYLYDGAWSYLFGFGGVDLNLDLVKKGYAEEWLYQGTYSRADEFLRAERVAQSQEIGGWKACADFKKHPRAGSSKRSKKKRVVEE